jgi:hypothetical protein
MDRRKFLLAALGTPVAAAAIVTKPPLVDCVRHSGVHFLFETITDPATQMLRKLAEKDKSPRRAQLVINSPRYKKWEDRLWGLSEIRDGNILWTQIATAPPRTNGPIYTVSCWSMNAESTINTRSAMGKPLSSFSLDHATGNTIYRKF